MLFPQICVLFPQDSQGWGVPSRDRWTDIPPGEGAYPVWSLSQSRGLIFRETVRVPHGTLQGEVGSGEGRTATELWVAEKVLLYYQGPFHGTYHITTQPSGQYGTW